MSEKEPSWWSQHRWFILPLLAFWFSWVFFTAARWLIEWYINS